MGFHMALIELCSTMAGSERLARGEGSRIEARDVHVYPLGAALAVLDYQIGPGLRGRQLLRGTAARTAIGSLEVRCASGDTARALVVTLRVLDDDPRLHRIEQVTLPASVMLLPQQAVHSAANSAPHAGWGSLLAGAYEPSETIHA